MRKKVFSIFLALVMVLCIAPMTTMAEGEENSWDIANGDITVTATAGGQTVTQGSKSLTDQNPVITGSSDQHSLTVTAESGATGTVTLSNLEINIPMSNEKAAIKTSGDGAVIIELDNANKLQSGEHHAGLEKSNGGMLTICDDNETAGSLDATGGWQSAGIGGGLFRSGNNITITGGTVTATGNDGAGIGGGRDGDGSNITITGGSVRAVGSNGAGIGGGYAVSGKGKVNGSNITITGGVVTAIGGGHAAGIGGGDRCGNATYSNMADGSSISITGGVVTAIGSEGGAGIGGGEYYNSMWGKSGGYGKNITISGNAQVKVCGSTAANGKVAAGIGNGAGGETTDTDENEGKETGDFSGLTAGGYVEYYASGADISTAAASYVRHLGNTERHEGDITVTEAVAATCSTTGNTLGIICSGNGENCGTVLVSEPVEMLAHSYKTEWTTDETFHWHACSECGAKTDEAKHTDTETKDHLCDVCGIELGKCADNLTHISAKAATTAEAGNIEYWYCDGCEKYYSDAEAAAVIPDGIDGVVIPKLPVIIKGNGQMVTAGEKKALEFTSDADYDEFVRVLADGKELSDANYTVAEGSTVVTLKADYVANLSVGEHTLGIVSENGTATAKFTVNKKAAETKSPQTGDGDNMFIWLALFLVSGGAAAAMIAGKRRKYNR